MATVTKFGPTVERQGMLTLAGTNESASVFCHLASVRRVVPYRDGSEAGGEEFEGEIEPIPASAEIPTRGKPNMLTLDGTVLELRFRVSGAVVCRVIGNRS
jgi:hypothetical protein